MEKLRKNQVFAVVLLLVLLVSVFPLGSWASSPESFAAVRASLDEKAETVLKLSAAASVTSAAISAIPDDAGTPLAEKLADFTEYFLLILCVLYAEKFLLPFLGMTAFRLLIPAGCVLLFAGYLRRSQRLLRLAVRLAVLGLVVFLAIPVSIQVSNIIDESCQAGIEQTIVGAETLDLTAEETPAGRNVLESTWNAVTSIPSKVEELQNRAAAVVNDFVQSLAVLIVTSCVAPLLVLLFFMWLVKLVTGVELRLPVSPRHERVKRKDGTEECR